ncbi:hypothetical protein ACFCWY_08645 [Streptomyces sp. NPDC056362]|uniref:hypothetical protein n=1 Tax=unclassified Streptomyces TaxID=2593676 RepID=UPI0035D84376
MTTAPTVTPHAQAAERARLIAERARNRYATRGTKLTLLRIAGLLDVAALLLDEDAPNATDTCISYPSEVSEMLWRADTLAEQHPETLLPVNFTGYVLRPLTGRPLPFPEPLHPLSEALALRELDLRNRLAQLHADTEQQQERPAHWLFLIFTLWQQHIRLAETVRISNARPCNQP